MLVMTTVVWGCFLTTSDIAEKLSEAVGFAIDRRRIQFGSDSASTPFRSSDARDEFLTLLLLWCAKGEACLKQEHAAAGKKTA